MDLAPPPPPGGGGGIPLYHATSRLSRLFLKKIEEKICEKSLTRPKKPDRFYSVMNDTWIEYQNAYNKWLHCSEAEAESAYAILCYWRHKFFTE